MNKPTRRLVVTAGCIALAAAVAGVSGAQAMVHGPASAHLDANRALASASSAHPSPTTRPTLSAPAIPAGTPSTSGAASPAGSATPITVVLPPAPGPAPAKADAATQVAVAPGNSSGGGGSSKKATTGGGGGGCHASSDDSSHQLDTASSYPQRADIANAVYSMINSERAANCLPALGRSSQLNSSANAHNIAMANSGDFDHQVAGEPDLAHRISATGYQWSSAGENIAWGSSASVSFAQSLEAEMYNETPPDDGHRLNILSTSFHNVGVDVITDGNGKMWITCDFGS